MEMEVVEMDGCKGEGWMQMALDGQLSTGMDGC